MRPRIRKISLCFFVLVFLWACGDDSHDNGSMPVEELSSSSESDSLQTFISESSYKEPASSINTPAGKSSSSVAQSSSAVEESTLVSAACPGFPKSFEFLDTYFKCESLIVAGKDSVWRGLAREDFDFSPYLVPSEEYPFELDSTDEDQMRLFYYESFTDSYDEEFMEKGFKFVGLQGRIYYISDNKIYSGYSLREYETKKNAHYDENYLELGIEVCNFVPDTTKSGNSEGDACIFEDCSSSSVKSSSSVESSSSAESSCSVESSSSAKSSSSSLPSSSSAVPSSSSYWFEIPSSSSITVPKQIALEEVVENAMESMWRNLMATNNFELSHNTKGYAYPISFGTSCYFVTKGRDKLYYEEKSSPAYNDSRNIINGNQRKYIDLGTKKTVVYETTQDYADSVRKALTVSSFHCPLDSGSWSAPVQVTDSIYRVEREDGAYFYYNSFKKVIEYYFWTTVLERGILANYEERYIYDETGHLNEVRILGSGYSEELGRSAETTLVTTIVIRSAENFPDRLFEI